MLVCLCCSARQVAVAHGKLLQWKDRLTATECLFLSVHVSECVSACEWGLRAVNTCIHPSVCIFYAPVCVSVCASCMLAWVSVSLSVGVYVCGGAAVGGHSSHCLELEEQMWAGRKPGSPKVHGPDSFAGSGQAGGQALYLPPSAGSCIPKVCCIPKVFWSSSSLTSELQAPQGRERPVSQQGTALSRLQAPRL